MGRKIQPNSRTWERRANELARSYAPEIAPCEKCNNPVIDGYLCTYCNYDGSAIDNE